jgi:hypothetical protein
MFRSPLVIPLIVGGAQFMHQFDGAVIATALPSMAASLHGGPVRLNLAITTSWRWYQRSSSIGFPPRPAPN